MDRATYLKSFGIEPTEVIKAISPATATTDSVDKMRERLEIRRLELELKKLETPDT